MLRVAFPVFRLRLLRFVWGIFGGVLPLLCVCSVSAQGNSAIAQQYQADDKGIVAASLVSIQNDNPNSIELGSVGNRDKLAGVVSNTPLIELSNGDSGVQVVTSGLTFALVSDLSGPIVSGDKITTSPITGVGMRADTSTTVVGTAQADLNAATAESRTMKDKQGKEVTVHIGLIPLQVGVVFYSIEPDESSAFVPPFLQTIANTVGGRTVSPIRVLVAGLILLLLFVSVMVLLYSAVRSSIISIGRNPLSENAVRKSLVHVALTVVTVLMLGVALMYLILRV